MISCGQTTPRETAALIERAALFLGHDTGTLHLAAAVQTRIIGLFSARDVPGKWYSDQTDDVFFYNKVPCFGCRLTEVSDCPNERACMTQHSVDEIVAVATVTLSPVGVSSRIQTSLSRSQPVDVV
jgi:ADP-heptose:LPS heptosyltransferase